MADGRSPTRLVFIRHGQSVSNAEGWISGNATCRGLTEQGRAEAIALRERLARTAELRPDAVLVSTMPRAIETAELLLPGLGTDQVEQVHELSERFPGECEGMAPEEYLERYGRRVYEDPVPAISPGGETLDEFFARVRRVDEEIAREHAGRTVVIVCHGGIIVGSALHLMRTELGPTTGRWKNPTNTSISAWSRRDDRQDGPWTLERYNDDAHLASLGEAFPLKD